MATSTESAAKAAQNERIKRTTLETTGPPPIEASSVTRLLSVLGLKTKFYGRRTELESLYNAIRDSVNDKTIRVIPIIGPTGVGKSRLVHEFLDFIDVETRRIQLLTTESVPDEATSSLRAAEQILRQRFGIEPCTSDEECHRIVKSGLQGIVDERWLAEATQLLGHLLGTHFADDSRPEVLALSEGLLQRALSTLANLLHYDAGRRPQVLVFDAYHLAPERTQETVLRLIEGLKDTATVALLLSHHPLNLDLPSEVSETVIKLAPLPNSDMTRVLRHLLRRVQNLPDALIERTVTRARGNPALLEDMVRLMMQREILLIQGDRWEFNAERLKRARLPATIQATAKARTKALPAQVRSILEVASVFGTTFWLGGILSIVRVERENESQESGLETDTWFDESLESDVNARLQTLFDLDLIDYRPDAGLLNQVAYGFVNPAEQERMYEGLSPERRRYLHALAAQWLSVIAPDDNFHYHEVVGWHLEIADKPRQAADSYVQAAQLARRTFQNQRAVELYRSALLLLSDADASRRCDVLDQLSELFIRIGRSEDAEESAKVMLSCSRIIESKPWGGRAFLFLGRAARMEGRHVDAMSRLESGIKLFQDLDDFAGLSTCQEEIGKVHWHRGELGSYKKALSLFLKSLTLRRKLGDSRAVAMSLTSIGKIQLARGHISEAQESFEEAQTLRQALDDRWGMAVNLIGLGAVHFYLDELDKALDCWNEALELSDEVGDHELSIAVRNNLAEVALKKGELENAEGLLTRARQVASDVRDNLSLAEILRNEAMLHTKYGDYETALSTLEEAKQLADSADGKQVKGRVLRTEGETLSAILSDTSNTDMLERFPDAESAASRAFQRSMNVFEKMGDQLGLAETMRAYGSFLVDRGVQNKGRKFISKAESLLHPSTR